jgi:hypothetical protein
MASYTIDTHPVRPTAPKPQSPSRRKAVKVAVGSVAAVGLIWAAWLFFPRSAPALTAPKAQLVKFVASDKFAALPADKKRAYMDALQGDPREVFQSVRDGKVTREEAQAVMERRMAQTMDDFFALPVGPQRDAFLDKMIDQRMAFRPTSRPTSRPANAGPGGPGGPGGRNNATAVKTRRESVPPDQRVKMAEFRKAMHDRMLARGINPPGGFGGPGGPRGGR